MEIEHARAMVGLPVDATLIRPLTDGYRLSLPRRSLSSQALPARSSRLITSVSPQPATPGMRAHDIAGTGPQFDDERLFRIIDAMDLIAEETGKSITQIALNWLLRQPTVATLIVGARDEAQLLQNIGALGWEMSEEQIARLDLASAVPAPYPVWHQRDFPMLHDGAIA